MPENKKAKTVLLAIFLIVVVLIVIVMGVLVYMLASDKIEMEERTNTLEGQINSLQDTTNKLQEQLNTIITGNTINEDDQNTVNSNSTSENSNQTTDENSSNNIEGTFSWTQNYTSESGENVTYQLVLRLHSDGTAEYSESDGMSSGETRGTYVYTNNQITYTRLYYNYEDNNNTEYTDENSKTVVFTVVADNTLQTTFNGQTANLTAQQ